MFDDKPPAAPPIDFLALPGFAEAKRRLEGAGRPSAWITELADTLNKCAVFLKDGRPGYRSQCPNYEGYWLDGGTGSVQCGAYGGLLPGLMWSTACRGDLSNVHCSCPLTEEAWAETELRIGGHGSR